MAFEQMRKVLFLLTFLGFSLIFTSCSIKKFISQSLEDFTTYFNTYYNAQRIFKEAEKEILKQQKDLFTSDKTPPPGNLTNKFVSVIEKCSKILQYNSKSSLVDNALMMIGKAYYYQREYPSAIRKFNELVINFQESPFYLEAKLWAAKSYSRTVEVEKANRLLIDLYEEAKTFENEEIINLTLLEMLKIYYSKNDYEKFIELGEEFINSSDDDEAIAQVMLQMGIFYSKLNKMDLAIDLLRKVTNYTDDYYYKFKSQLELAKVYREKLNFDLAEKILNKLDTEPLYNDYKDYIYLEKAYIFRAKGDSLEALNYFVRIDTTYPSKEAGGIAQFELAKYLEENGESYDSAKFYYDKCIRSQAPKELIQIASNKSKIFTRYKSIWTSINNFEKQIAQLRKFPIDTTYPKFQEIEIDSSMLNDSAYLADLQEYLAEKKKADSIYAAKLARDSIIYLNNLKTADSIEVNIARLKFDLGTLFFIDLDKPDSAFYYFEYIVRKNPNQELTEKALYALANYYDKVGNNAKADSLFQIIYNNYSDSEISEIVAKKLGLTPKRLNTNYPDLEYYRGEKLIEAGKIHDAIKHFYLIYEKYNRTDYGPKALGMIGYLLEEKLMLNDSAYNVYKLLKEKYPGSVYTQRINSKLLAYESELQRKEQEKKLEEEKLKQEEQNIENKNFKNGNLQEREKQKELENQGIDKFNKSNSNSKKDYEQN